MNKKSNEKVKNMEELIKIPDDRIGVLIGPKGSVRAKIAKKGKCKIEIDSQYGEVFIEGEGEEFFRAVDVIKAIGRGFSPERAFKLFEHDYLLKIIDITDYTGKSKSTQKAKRGRVIGRKGLARTEIEKKTHALISVQGKTVAIIALPDEMNKAEEAVKMLLQGAKHDTVDRYLDGHGANKFEL